MNTQEFFNNIGLLRVKSVLKLCGFAWLLGSGLVEAADETAFSQYTRMRAMSYNVQNLFDTRDDPKTLDEEFTPKGKQLWTESVLNDKMDNLGEIVKDVNPDILALQEVENQAVLDQFVARGLKGQGYQTVITRESEDPRGIRNALVSRFPAVKNLTQSHNVTKPTWGDSKTRDILEVVLQTPRKQLVTVFVNHWPSRRRGAESEKFRKDVAAKLTDLVSQTLKSRPEGLVLVMGDFNDELENESLKGGLSWVRKLSELFQKPLGFMLSIDSEWDSLTLEKRGTFYFHRDRVWNAIDHMFYAEGASLTESSKNTYRYQTGSYSVVKPQAKFLGDKGSPQGCEILPDIGVYNGRNADRCQKGASDHFAIKADFVWRE
jgi:endonuclease/exonuclease/phosphatase family metal-dependent hydrolase